jgi:anaerobic selenocysteine-containing dehydrogenase
LGGKKGGNPLLSYPNANETFQAMKRLDFLTVSEIFLTPTAQLADIVLPAATNFEFDASAILDSLTDSSWRGQRFVEPFGGMLARFKNHK